MPFSFPDWLLQRSEKNSQLSQEGFNYFDSKAINSGHTNLYQQTDSCILYREICTDMYKLRGGHHHPPDASPCTG